MTPKKEAVISTAAINANMRIVFIGDPSIWDVVLVSLPRAQRVHISLYDRGISAEMIHRKLGVQLNRSGKVEAYSREVSY
jgi:hypothetical protein